ncbi:unnamed protein product, partial [Prorocentrum cordatum]
CSWPQAQVQLRPAGRAAARRGPQPRRAASGSHAWPRRCGDRPGPPGQRAADTVQTSSWSFSNLRGLAFARSSSSSSVSWGLGSDGHVHREVHRVESGVYQDKAMQKAMRSEVGCVDGHCRQQVTYGYEPASASRLQRALELMGVRRAPALAAAVAVANSLRRPPPPPPPPPTAPARSACAAPWLATAGRRWASRAREPARWAPRRRVALEFAGSSLLAVLVFVLGKHLRQRVEASELAVPLAGDGVPAPAVAPAASRPRSAGAVGPCSTRRARAAARQEGRGAEAARDVAKAYLACLYAEAAVPTGAYLARVYARALA